MGALPPSDISPNSPGVSAVTQSVDASPADQAKVNVLRRWQRRTPGVAERGRRRVNSINTVVGSAICNKRNPPSSAPITPDTRELTIYADGFLKGQAVTAALIGEAPVPLWALQERNALLVDTLESRHYRFHAREDDAGPMASASFRGWSDASTVTTCGAENIRNR